MSAKFNKKNFFGRHCVWAGIPGWAPIDFDTRNIAGVTEHFLSVGQRKLYDITNDNSDSRGLRTVIDNYGRGVGRARVIRSYDNGTGLVPRLLETGPIADNGIQNLGDTPTIIAIVKPVGDGNTGGNDPRYYSEDQGDAEANHDLMLGSVRAAPGSRARTRININGTTTTVVSAQKIQSDSLNLVAGIVVPDGSLYRGVIHHIREDGVADRVASGTKSGGYTPRTTTNAGFFANSGTTANYYTGDIIGVWAFNTPMDSETLMREFFDNPWQVFAPQRIHVPMITTEIVVAGEGPATTVFITDVNTTEIWNDGDTGLVITGSGFRGA